MYPCETTQMHGKNTESSYIAVVMNLICGSWQSIKVTQVLQEAPGAMSEIWEQRAQAGLADLGMTKIHTQSKYLP